MVSQKRTSKQKCKEQIIQYLAFLLSKEVSSYLDEKEKLETELEQTSQEGKALNAEITRLNQEIAALNKHNVNTEATIESINRILKDSGFQGFSIRAKKILKTCTKLSEKTDQLQSTSVRVNAISSLSCIFTIKFAVV